MNITDFLPTRTRSQVIACAKDWADRQIPYCQCNGPAECKCLFQLI